MKAPKRVDPRFKALVPQLETLPREVRDALVMLLEGAIRVQQLVKLDRKERAQRKLRAGEESKERG